MKASLALLPALMLAPLAALNAADAPAKQASAPSPSQTQAAAYYFPNWHRLEGQTDPNFAEWGFIPRATPRFAGHQLPRTRHGKRNEIPGGRARGLRHIRHEEPLKAATPSPT